MNIDHNDQLGEGLIYEDLVPLSWKEVGANIKPAQIIRIQDENEDAFRHIAALEEKRHEFSDDMSGPVAVELARIDFKLNLLFDMVSRLLEQQVDAPPALPITMSASGVQWQTDDAPVKGSHIQLDIYLNRKYPRPIVLFGYVQDVQSVDGQYIAHVDFEQMSDVIQRYLEKLIFRHHRRYVAFSRHAAMIHHQE